MAIPSANLKRVQINEDLFEIPEYAYNNMVKWATVDGVTDWVLVTEMVEVRGRIVPSAEAPEDEPEY